MTEMFCVLQMKVEIQANPCNIFDSAQTKLIPIKNKRNDLSKTTVRTLMG
jgi:hypothetical protein